MTRPGTFGPCARCGEHTAGWFKGYDLWRCAACWHQAWAGTGRGEALSQAAWAAWAGAWPLMWAQRVEGDDADEPMRAYESALADLEQMAHDHGDPLPDGIYYASDWGDEVDIAYVHEGGRWRELGDDERVGERISDMMDVLGAMANDNHPR